MANPGPGWPRPRLFWSPPAPAPVKFWPRSCLTRQRINFGETDSSSSDSYFSDISDEDYSIPRDLIDSTEDIASLYIEPLENSSNYSPYDQNSLVHDNNNEPCVEFDVTINDIYSFYTIVHVPIEDYREQNENS